MTSKPCHAIGCTERIERHKLMCPRHWRMVSPLLQQQVITTWTALTDGRGGRPYLITIARAQLAVAAAEHIENAETERTRAKLKEFSKGVAK